MGNSGEKERQELKERWMEKVRIRRSKSELTSNESAFIEWRHLKV